MTGQVPAPSILLVEDDEAFRRVLARALVARGYNVAVAESPDEAVWHLLARAPDFAIVDLRMPGGSGLTLIADVKRIHPTTSVIVLTADGSDESIAEAIRCGASSYLTKPIDADEIVSALRAIAGISGGGARP
jgi:two-component system response regulator RegA